MADPFAYTPVSDDDDISQDKNITFGIGGLLSPASAQSLVMPPPSTAPKTGAGQTTPQTGSLATAPSQAQPKVSGPAMLPGIATKPEDLAARTYERPQPTSISSVGGRNTILRDLNGTAAGHPLSAPSIARSGLAGAFARQQQAYAARPQLGPAPLMPVIPGYASSLPSLPYTASARVNGPSQLDLDQARLNYLQNSGSGVSQIKRPWLRDLLTVGDDVLRVGAPGVEQVIKGGQGYHDSLVDRQRGIIANDQQQLQSAANLADTQSQTNQRNAQAAGLIPVMVTPEMHAQNPALIVGSMIRPADYGKTLNTQTQNAGKLDTITQKDITAAAAKGQKPVYGDASNPQKVTSFEDDKTSAAYQSRTIQDGLRQAQQEEAEAKAELARAGNDPTSPAYKLALRKAQTASSNAAAANIRAQAYALNANAGNLGVDNQGNPINGSGIIGGRPVGSRFAPQASKAIGNISKYQDIYSSIDNANSAIDEGDKNGVKFNTAGMAAALSDPKTTAAQWITGQINTTLNPQEQNVVITTKALREQINAMRASLGGGVSDSQIDRLVDQLPSATTPSMGYARKQLATVRQQLDRLQSGLIGVNNGPKLQAPGSPANPTNPGGVPNRIPANQPQVRYAIDHNGQRRAIKLSPDGKSWIDVLTRKAVQ